jgi:hypothetical protein
VLDACALPWTLQSVGGGSSGVVVACGSDVRREPLSLTSAVASAIAPALKPTQERLCACAARLPVPPFVDLTVTASLEDGRASAQASELDDEMDPERGPAFLACIGTVTATFASAEAFGVCPGGRRDAIVRYPIRVELIR